MAARICDPRARVGEYIAHAVLFLVSDDARTITGQSINVNAGGVMVG